ncbi:hypothetical protein HHK36_017598 [Tetracentron sinense]|uniref:Uncharacterized protein n=1 Tax=Tetracentron sinense TaxID=13715 RepID=A0A835DCR4_TETSI|nr:hypothetical protein HHK36_017598 [Tetracentron sinense]
MAMSSNRSPSPISSRKNPDSRTPESCSGIRSSFSGNRFTRPSIVPNSRSFNPITPANSPADFSQRNSVGKEGIASLRMSYEQKENEADQNSKPVRARSPVVSKGLKNFMAPTISAASKVAASPRKSVLTERNEGVRMYPSFSDGKPPFTAMNVSEAAKDIGSNSEMGLDSKSSSDTQKKPGSLSEPIIAVADSESKEANFVNPSISEASKIAVTPNGDRSSVLVSGRKLPFSSMDGPGFAAAKVSESKQDPVLDSQVLSESLSERRVADLGSKVNPSPVIDNIDVDPYLPPYDPNTNYLSPRPQFLHYKPNPRIEISLNEERGFDPGEGKRLEDSFTSESCSDTEETQSEEDACSSQTSEEEEKENPFSESDPDNSRKLIKEIPRPRSFSRRKSIPLLLVLVIACLSISVTDSPVFSPSMPKDQTFPMLDDTVKLAELAKANLDGLAHNFRLWSASYVSYLFKLIPIPGEVEKLGPFHFSNLTVLVDGYQSLDSSYKGGVEMEPKEEEGHLEIQIGENTEDDITGGGSNVEFEEQSPLVPQAQEMEPHNREAVEFQDQNDFALESEKQSTPISQALEIEPHNREAVELQDENEFALESEEQSTLISQALEIEPHNREAVELQIENEFALESEEQSTPISQALEIEPELSEAYEFLDKSEFDSHDNIESTNAEVTSRTLGSDSAVHGLEYKISTQNVVGITSIVLILIAATIFIYLKQGVTNPEASVPVNHLPTKKLISSSVSANRDHPYQERRSSLNSPTEVEMMGGSCPSEMSSSFQNGSSYSRMGSERVNEVQSHERKLRRNSNGESLASSSEYSAGSPSYGSFTTYEKIRSRHGCGDEEMVTPIRRSSRIRKQITSP